MNPWRMAAAVVFAGSVVVGTLIDVPRKVAPRGPSILAADLHVHAFPADGALPVWEIQREAERRGLDVIAITNHNRNFAMPLARASGLLRDYPIVIAGEEVTTPAFHLAAIGVQQMIDWRLSPPDAIAEIHSQGGVAIAAHPVSIGWPRHDAGASGMLDGAEVAHPILFDLPKWEGELEAFYERGRELNPHLAPIGSSDFHFAAPLGICRTYLIVDDMSQAGVLDAIRRGRTVAAMPDGRLIGDDANVALVRPRASQARPARYGWPALAALTALMALAVLV